MKVQPLSMHLNIIHISTRPLIKEERHSPPITIPHLLHCKAHVKYLTSWPSIGQIRQDEVK